MRCGVLRQKIGWQVVLVCLTLLGQGCEEETVDRQVPAFQPVDSPLEFKVLVYDDPALAAMIARLAGEWTARCGDRYTVTEAKLPNDLTPEPPRADIVVFPERLLGALAERGLIVPMRKHVLQHRDYDLGDQLPLIQTAVSRWGGETMVVPLGSAVPMLYYRADMLETPPTTWAEYDRLASQLHQRGPTDGERPWSGALEPLAGDWAAISLLARAAPYAQHPDNVSGLFSIDRMEPLIESPPFVRALQELCNTAQAVEMPALNPHQIRRAVYAGQCALGITWPTHAAAENEAQTDAIALAALPGSPEVYHPGLDRWDILSRDADPRVTLLGAAGRLAAVVQGSKHVLDAQRLLIWLAGREIGSRISSASQATAPFRTSQLGQAHTWLESQAPPELADRFGDQLQAALKRKRQLFVPRLPGAAAYLTTLAAEVRRAAAQECTAQAALHAAANRWRVINAQRGQESQRQAYLRSLRVEGAH